MGCEEVCRSCKKEIEMKNKTWVPGRKIHCQGENRVIAWAAKDLMQHRISSTLFLIWRQLRFRSLITFLWFLVWTVTVGPDSQRFPTDYTTWEPKALSGASEGRRCMCVGTWESFGSQVHVQTQTHEDVLVNVSWAPSAHHGDQSVALLTDALAPHWLESPELNDYWQRVWLSWLGRQWHFAHSQPTPAAQEGHTGPPQQPWPLRQQQDTRHKPGLDHLCWQ